MAISALQFLHITLCMCMGSISLTGTAHEETQTEPAFFTVCFIFQMLVLLKGPLLSELCIFVASIQLFSVIYQQELHRLIQVCAFV